MPEPKDLAQLMITALIDSDAEVEEDELPTILVDEEDRHAEFKIQTWDGDTFLVTVRKENS